MKLTHAELEFRSAWAREDWEPRVLQSARSSPATGSWSRGRRSDRIHQSLGRSGRQKGSGDSCRRPQYATPMALVHNRGVHRPFGGSERAANTWGRKEIDAESRGLVTLDQESATVRFLRQEWPGSVLLVRHFWGSSSGSLSAPGNTPQVTWYDASSGHGT